VKKHYRADAVAAVLQYQVIHENRICERTVPLKSSELGFFWIDD
jgi:hypothetical protein